jgi:molybdate/tungstate transport system ATP-binding protein
MITTQALNVTLSDFKLRDIDLAIGENEFFVLMGPTGAGKTVLLEAIAGLVPVKGGKIFIQEKEISRMPPEKRGIGIVYQDHALFPHLTVRKNILYGLHFHRIDRTETQRRFDHLIEVLKIANILDRLPVNLSGGEKQRVALARALIVEPKVLLLDEPLSALDPNFREGVRSALKELHQSSRITFLMVTHDFTDALFLADRAAVLNQGCIEQTGTVTDVFEHPVSPFVAEFVGMKNVFPATFQGDIARLGDLDITLQESVDASCRYLSIRPEDVTISRQSLSGNDDNTLKGRIVELKDYGFYYTVSVKTRGPVFLALIPKSTFFDMQVIEGSEVYVNLKPSRIHTF